MKLNAAQQASLARMRKYRSVPPTLLERVRLAAMAMFILLLPIAILGYVMLQFEVPGTLPLLIGLYIGALAREIGQQRQFVRWWHLTQEVTNWDKVDQLLAHGTREPEAARPGPPPGVKWGRAVSVGVAIFALIFGALVSAERILGFVYDPRRGNAPDRVVMLSASWCGYCMSLRRHLTEMEVPYTDLDVEETTEGRWAHVAVGGGGVPVTIVGSQVIRGLDEKGGWGNVDVALIKAGYEIPPKPRAGPEKVYGAGETASADWEMLALDFSKALVARNYVGAYDMTSTSFQAAHSLSWLRQHMEHLFRQSADPFGPCKVESSGQTNEPSDVGAVYVSIGGTNNEALFVFITRENGDLRVRDLDIGRP